MIPKEKAQELVCKMYGCEINTDLDDIYHLNGDGYFIAISAAKEAVDEIIKSNELDYFMTKDEIDSLEVTSDDLWLNEKFNKYWKEVKKELSKI